MSSKKEVHVVVGVIQRRSKNGEREILISKRHKEVHQGGLWEFPGGKVESGEALPNALARELEEELGLILDSSDDDALRPLIQISHDYGDKKVLLDVWLVTKFFCAPGDGLGQEGQQVKWVNVDSLEDFNFPAANVPIISACQLPERYIITPSFESLVRAKEGLEVRLKDHSGLILFRQPVLELEAYFTWLDELLMSIPDLGNRLMLSANFAGSPQEIEPQLRCFEEYKGRVKGVHFPFSLAKKFSEKVIDQNFLMAVSCHSVEELRCAEEMGADFVTLSPVCKTSSHPEAEAMGWSRFEEWVKLVAMPVYALGGLTDFDLIQSFKSGAQGVAGISAWSTNN